MSFEKCFKGLGNLCELSQNVTTLQFKYNSSAIYNRYGDGTSDDWRMIVKSNRIEFSYFRLTNKTDKHIV